MMGGARGEGGKPLTGMEFMSFYPGVVVKKKKDAALPRRPSESCM
jgi:hypothetical protein